MSYPPYPGQQSQPMYPPMDGGVAPAMAYPRQHGAPGGYPQRGGGYPGQYPGGGGHMGHSSRGQPGYPQQQQYPQQRPGPGGVGAQSNFMGARPGFQGPPGQPGPAGGRQSSQYMGPPGYQQHGQRHRHNAGVQQGGYPPQQGGYPPQQGGYPPQQGGGYPPQQGGYPPSQPGGYGTPGYPQQYGAPQQGGYPPQHHGGHHQQQGGYPPQQGGYPPQQQGGYPPQQQQGYPPQQQGGYPPQQPGGYPPQQQQQYPPAHTPHQVSAPAPHAPAPQAPQAHAPMAHPSIKPTPGFNAQTDAKTLRDAMKGFGCNESKVVDVLCKRTANERQQIKLAFKTMYGKDLVKEIISELRGNMEDLMVSLLDRSDEFDAKELRNAMSGVGTNEATLMEILSTRTNAEIMDIKLAYKRLFNRDLEKDLKSETSFNFERLLVALSCGGRDESTHTDANRARQDAQELLKAGVKKIGTDEGAFFAVLVGQNPHQQQLVFQEYQKLAGHDIETALKREFSGDIENGLITLVQCCKNRPAYFAERLMVSMRGMGTKDRDLCRVIITRCEKDMVQIKQEYQRLYKKTLESAISGDTSGKYKAALLSLVQGN